MLEALKIVSFSHKDIPINELGCLVLDEQDLERKLKGIRDDLHLEELSYTSTCNRIEYVLVSDREADHGWLNAFIRKVYPHFNDEQRQSYLQKANLYCGDEAVRYLFRVASSLESFVVGEMEILSQMRKDYERTEKWGLTGEILKMIYKRAILNAKEVFAKTSISSNPVSVSSLACRELNELVNDKSKLNILLIGAGETNRLVAKYLLKHGYKNFTVFNRTLSKAKVLAGLLGGKGYSLDDLESQGQDWDVIISCTASSNPIIQPDLYKKITKHKRRQRIIVDLAVPGDVHPDIVAGEDVRYINIASLMKVAEENKVLRTKEIGKAHSIVERNMKALQNDIRNRTVELEMREVPEKIKEIRKTALEKIFHDKLNASDTASKELISEILDYMEKKYIAIPMKMAKKILIKNCCE